MADQQHGLDGRAALRVGDGAVDLGKIIEFHEAVEGEPPLLVQLDQFRNELLGTVSPWMTLRTWRPPGSRPGALAPLISAALPSGFSSSAADCPVAQSPDPTQRGCPAHRSRLLQPIA